MLLQKVLSSLAWQPSAIKAAWFFWRHARHCTSPCALAALHSLLSANAQIFVLPSQYALSSLAWQPSFISTAWFFCRQDRQYAPPRILADWQNLRSAAAQVEVFPPSQKALSSLAWQPAAIKVAWFFCRQLVHGTDPCRLASVQSFASSAVQLLLPPNGDVPAGIAVAKAVHSKHNTTARVQRGGVIILSANLK